jgi:hypothetical protein
MARGLAARNALSEPHSSKICPSSAKTIMLDFKAASSA